MILYRGRTYRKILQAMIAGAQSDRHAFFVVPDRYSLEAEQLLLDLLPDGATVRCEVTTLARIVNRLCDKERKRLSAEGAVMAVADIMRRNCENLQCIRADAYGGSAAEVFATIEQLAASGVMPEDLSISEQDTALVRKLEDLRLIYSQYRAFLEKGFSDASDDVLSAIRAVGSQEWIKNSDFYLVGYDSLTRANRRLTEEIARIAHSVTIGGIEEGEYAPENILSQFRASSDAVVDVPSNLTPWKEHLFTFADDDRATPIPVAELAKEGESLSCLIVDGRTEGVERIARDIANEVACGARFSDFAVLTESAQEVAEVFGEYGILCNADQSYPLSRDPLSGLITAAFESALTRCAASAIKKLAVNPLLCVHADDYAVWENYVTKFGVNHGLNLSPFTLESDDPTERATAEKVRALVAEIIRPFLDRVTLAETTGAFVDACIELTRQFSERAHILRTEFLPEDADFSAQAETKLLEILDNLNYTPDAPIEADAFFRVLNSGIRAARIRVTPTYADAVKLLSADSFGFDEYRRVYLLGADEGHLPTPQSDCGLISDSDIDRLHSVGALIDPKISEVNARARTRVFITLFYAPQIVLVVTSREPNQLARTLMRMYLIVPSPADEDALILSETMGDDGRGAAIRAAASPSVAMRTARRMIERARSRGSRRLSTAASALVTATGCEKNKPERPVERAHELFFGKERTSISQIEQFFTCPYKHFTQYGLRCSERSAAEIKSNDIGTFLHAVAQRFALLSPKDVGECDEFAKCVTEQVVEETPLWQLPVPNIKLAKERLTREAVRFCRRLYEYASRSAYRTESTETYIGKDLPPLVIADVDLRGYIDRVDGDGREVVIIDYKTGKSEYTLTDVYYGKQIQLFAYMSVLVSQGRRPAAALFFPVSNDFGKTSPCSGWVSADMDIVAKLDSQLDLTNTESEFLPIGLSKTYAKKGERVLTNAERAFSESDWKNWLGYTQKLIEGAVTDADSGLTCKRPLSLSGKLPCAYCPSRGACTAAPAVRAPETKVKKSSIDPSAIEGRGKEASDV